MSGPMMRGYVLVGANSYLLNNHDEDRRERIYGGLSPEARQALTAANRVEWYPRPLVVEVLRGIAGLHSTDKAAYDDLLGCGRSIAYDASTTFLRLLMKILTPNLFAKKIPDIWKRDSRGGSFEAHIPSDNDRLIHMRLSDVAGFDHVGPMAAGWITFAMTAMGKKGLNVALEGWSLKTPGPEELQFAVTWQ